MVDSSNFYKALRSLRSKFAWIVDENNNIVAVKGNSVYNPITAIAATVGYSSPSNNKRETLKVARALGMEKDFAEQVYSAVNCLTNRGNAQIVRGKVREALGL
jgi:hypothetical protein